ncbi:hypothetical protein Btru_045425 [Bulinus truncatus]|nr:hypothetical protein Btru_045425 [Bulinus truncatus]
MCNLRPVLFVSTWCRHVQVTARGVCQHPVQTCASYGPWCLSAPGADMCKLRPVVFVSTWCRHVQVTARCVCQHPVQTCASYGPWCLSAPGADMCKLRPAESVSTWCRHVQVTARGVCQHLVQTCASYGPQSLSAPGADMCKLRPAESVSTWCRHVQVTARGVCQHLVQTCASYARGTNTTQYRIGALNPKGQAGYTFRFCIRMHPLLFKDVKENTFQIQLFWKNSSKVQQNCLVTADEEEDYPVQMQDGTVTSVDAPITYTRVRDFDIVFNLFPSTRRVRVFEFKIMDPGEYGVSAKPTVDFLTDKSRQQQGPKLNLRRLGVNTETVNINQSKLLEDIQTAFITVVDDRSNLKYDDCILSETFNINGDEAKPNYPDRPTYIDDAESIVLKRINNRVCSDRQTIQNKWFLERIKITDTETSMGICPNYRKVGLMDLAKYVSLKTRLPLQLNMTLPSLVIQPYVLPSDRYHICVDFFRVDYSRRVCGYFETHVENAQYAFIVHVKPEEEKFTWPRRDLTINASQSVYLYETLEAGYLLAPTLRFTWTCEGDDFQCENIISRQQYSTQQGNDTKEANQQLKTDSVMVIKKEWMVEKSALVIKCEMSIKSKDSTTFTTSFIKEITFSSYVDQIEVPYIQIRCLTNCWRYAVPKEDLLLGIVCNDCEEFTLQGTQITWEMSDPDLRSNCTSELYLVITDLEDVRAKDFLVSVVFDFKHHDSDTRIILNTTRRFYMAERFDDKSVESFSFKRNRETIVRKEASLRSTDFSAVLTALDEEYHYPLIYNLKALGKDVENIEEYDPEIHYDSCKQGEVPLAEFHSCVFLTVANDWSSSLTTCRQHHVSADLTIILSQRKNDLLKRALGKEESILAQGYSNWHVKGRTSNSTKTQCVYADADWLWRLADCDEPIGAICEYFPYKEQRRYSMLIAPTIPTDFVYESSDQEWEVFISVHTAMGILVHTRNQILQRIKHRLSFVICLPPGLTHLAYLTGELDKSRSDVRAETVAKILKKLTENRPVLDYGSLNVVLVSLERLVSNIQNDITDLIRAHTLLSKIVHLHTRAPNFAENDYILNKYELHVIDLLIQVYLKLRQSNRLPTGPEMIILSEGIMQTLDDILTLIVEKKAKGYPDVLHYKLINSHSFVTWVDCSQRKTILMDLKTVSLNMDMRLFFSAVNLFSLDPFLNIGAYTSSWSPMPDRIDDIKIHLPLLVVNIRQKQPTQYALSEFVPDLYDIRFKTDLSAAASKNYFYRIKMYDAVQTGTNTKKFSDSDCVLIKLAMSKDFSTVLRVRSEIGLKLQVRILLAKSVHDVLNIMHESPLVLPREVESNDSKSASINEDVVFLPKLTLDLASPGRSKNGSPERSENGSPERSKNGSPERSKNGSTGRSKNGSPGRSKNGSPGRSKNGSPERSKNGSPVRSKNGSPERSKNGSPGRSKNGSRERSKNGSPERSKNGSPGRSKNGSPGRPKNGSPGRSKNGSPGRSKNGSPERSENGSPERSKNGSPGRSKNGSPERSKKWLPRKI